MLLLLFSLLQPLSIDSNFAFPILEGTQIIFTSKPWSDIVVCGKLKGTMFPQICKHWKHTCLQSSYSDMPGMLHATHSRTPGWLFFIFFDFFWKLGLNPSTKNLTIFYCLWWLQFWISQAAARFSVSEWQKCWAPQSQTICLLLFCCFSYCRVFLWLSPLLSSSLHSSMMHFLYFLWELRFNSHLFLFCLQASIWLQVLNYRFFSTFLQDTTTASIENTLMPRSINSISWTRGSSTQPGPTSWKSQKVLQVTARSLPPASSGPRTVSLRRRTSKNSLKGSCTNSATPNNFSSVGTAPPGQRKFTKFLFHTFQVALRSQIFAVTKDLRTGAMLMWRERQGRAGTSSNWSKP